MSIRLDPRRLQALKHLAGEAGTRPGDLVRRWVEERIDAQRVGDAGVSLESRVAALEKALAALAPGSTPPDPAPVRRGQEDRDEDASAEPEAQAAGDDSPAEPTPEPMQAEGADGATSSRARRVSASPTAKVALHDEMIAVLGERGPMTASELAAAIVERGRYAPPRSGKSLDGAMVSQRASNPAYRSRFVRREGRIGLVEQPD